MLDDFLKLVADSRPPSDLTFHQNYVTNDSHDNALVELTRGLLSIFDPVPGACFMMSALLASGIRKHLGLPAAVVVGDLLIGPYQLYVTTPNQDWTELARVSGTVEGHAWVQLGERVIDASVLRTIALRAVPQQIADIVNREVGEGRGALFGRFPLVEPFFYQPKYVLTPEQEELLAAAAYVQFVERPQKTADAEQSASTASTEPQDSPTPEIESNGKVAQQGHEI